ncbi:hypothetical protein IKW73_01170 [Candidatus Saccharibacteria bacterium]|nr:hypothetical protein [Candidatus Saccharibacteria bacterium]
MGAAKNNQILTVVEGRIKNQPIVDDFKRAAENRGWGFQHVSILNSDEIARYDFSDTPLDNVVFRELTNNNYVEAERLFFYLKKNHKIVMNADAAGARAATSDKHFQQGLFLLDPFLKKHALPTFEAKHKLNVMSYIKGDRVHFPILLKYRYGTAGRDIILIKNEAELDKVKSFKGFLIEQYIEAECDWRVFVIGGTPVGIMRKIGDTDHPDNFVAWSGGREKFLEEDQDMIEILGKIACRAAAVSRLEYTGVDILKEKGTGKLYLLETNYAAGWLNFTSATNINIPDLVIDWFVDRAEGLSQPIEKAVKTYIEHRKKYLSRETSAAYDAILKGEKGITEKIAHLFKDEDSKYLYDTGTIFNKLSKAYKDLTESKDKDSKKYDGLAKEIEEMPLSWTGNFIGPEAGTIEEGAILSALYLFLLGKIKKV